jgi:outer membrane murein-binding lipoprotein Lpp
MKSLPKQLPNDIDALKVLVAEQAAHNEELRAQKRVDEKENIRLNAKVLSLQEQLNLALARRYAASSEKFGLPSLY